MTLDCAVEMPNCIVVGLLGGYILSITPSDQEAMQRLMTSAAVPLSAMVGMSAYYASYDISCCAAAAAATATAATAAAAAGAAGAVALALLLLLLVVLFYWVWFCALSRWGSSDAHWPCGL
jgi:Na+/H+-dicarboxylate symporter